MRMPKQKLFAGLDVGETTTAICLMDQSGQIVSEMTAATTPAAIADALKPYRRKIAQVGQESGSKAVWLHRGLTRFRFPMITLDAWHSHSALGARPNKTDKTDARGLCILLCRGHFTSIHIKSDDAASAMTLLTIRKTVLRKALDLQKSLRMILRASGGDLERKGRGKKILVAQQWFVKGETLDIVSQALVRANDALMAELAKLDRLVKDLADDDAVCRRLMTVPGVGPVTALLFRASVDDPARFASSRDVPAYFGLTPRQFQSGKANFAGHISRRGNLNVRGGLYVAATCLLNRTKTSWPLQKWGRRLWKEKGFKVAAVACARKLAVVMHQVWISGGEFEIPKSAKPRSARSSKRPHSPKRLNDDKARASVS